MICAGSNPGRPALHRLNRRRSEELSYKAQFYEHLPIGPLIVELFPLLKVLNQGF